MSSLVTVSPLKDRKYHWRYVRAGAPPPRWGGSAPRLFGWGDIVTERDYMLAWDGFYPDGKAAVQNAGAENRQPGLGLTINLSKPVTVYAVAAGDDICAEVLACDNDATDRTIQMFEERLGFSRRGQQGHVVEHCKLACVVHQHFANRLNEPHFHKHIDVLNIGLRADGTAGTILSKPFFTNKMAIGAFHRAQLAANLQRKLGLELVVEGTSFRIKGVPQSLCDANSTRRKGILNRLKSGNFHSSKAADVAALNTRPAKDEPPLDELMKTWREQAKEHGFTEEKAKALLNRAKPRDLATGLANALREGVEQVQYEKSYFSEMELLERVCNAALKHGVSGEECLRGVEATLKRPELVDLGHFNGFQQYTTRENLAIEDRLLQQVRDRRNDGRFVLRERVVEKFLDKHLPLNSSLTEDERLRNIDQRKAVEHMALGKGQVVVLGGYAGTAKTFSTGLYQKLAEEHGFIYTGIAQAGVAARNLEQATGIQSETLAMRLKQVGTTTGEQVKHHATQLVRAALDLPTFQLGAFELTPRHVVVVDEAGMISARQLLELVTHVFKAGARLLIVGDHRQLPPIDRGSPLNAIVREIGQYELTHIVRQGLDGNDPRPTWARDVVRHLANGEAREAIGLLAERGKVSVAKDRESAITSLIKDWSVEGGRDQKNALILAPTNAEVELINRRIQIARLNALAAEGVTQIDAAKNGETTIYVGDRVRFTKKSRRLDLENGQRGEVVAVAARGKALIVRTDSGRDVVVNNKQYPNLKLGWCSSVHSAQGATVEFAYHLIGGRMTTNQLSYVMASRGRQQNRFYTDQHEAGEDLGGLVKQAGLDRSKKIARDLKPLDDSREHDQSEQKHGRKL